MTLEIETNGRTYTVGVERDPRVPSRYRVTVDGVVHDVDALSVAPETLSVILQGEPQVSYEVGFVDSREPGEVAAYVNGLLVPLLVNGRRLRHGGGLGAGTGEQRIVAPMPGRVLRVLVGPGDAVAARQPLLVVEAMKMENELSCARPGRVREVAVSPGASVEAGRLLMVVE